MVAAVESQNMHTKAFGRWVTPGLIIILLLLRSMITVSRLLVGTEPGWVAITFETGTYLLVSILLIHEKHFLKDFHITPLAIWMIILFKPIETLWYAYVRPDINSPFAFPKYPSLIIWAIALVLLVFFRSRLFQKHVLLLKDWIWLGCGFLGGLVIIVITAYPVSFVVGQVDSNSITPFSSLIVDGLLMIPYQIGLAAISEEPVFRGFLWGYLRKSGCKDIWIWLIQAILFLLAHLYYLVTAPILFWFMVPVGALGFGWLAWRSRSIATSMVAHGVANGLGYTFGYIAEVLRS